MVLSVLNQFLVLYFNVILMLCLCLDQVEDVVIDHEIQSLSDIFLVIRIVCFVLFCFKIDQIAPYLNGP